MTRPDEQLEDLARAVADGSPVNWGEAAKQGDAAGHELAALKQIHELHAKHRQHVLDESNSDLLRKLPRANDRLHQGFDVQEELGAGAFGRVFKARDLALDRVVALKILDRAGAATPEERARFIREAQLLASVEHENVLHIWSIDEREGALRLSLEFIDGVTLKHLVEEQGPLSADEAARIGIDLCRALAAAHAKGLVHRDVKPANAMRAQGGRIVLLDFGLAHAVASARTDAVGATPGTPFMMAPEARDQPDQIGPATDLYALGVSLYWLVCGNYPWDTANIDELFDEKCAGRFKPMTDRRADVPPEFATILHRAIDRDPTRRFATAGELELALQEFLSRRPGAPPTVPVKEIRPKKRRLATLLVAAAAVIAGAFAWGFWPRPKSVAPPFKLDCAYFLHRQTDDGKTFEREVALAEGSEVRPGDGISLMVTVDRPLYLYVINEDAADAVNNLFPVPTSQLKNPIFLEPEAGPVRLPGPDAEGHVQCWKVTSSGNGQEAFIVIASTERNSFAEFFQGTYPYAGAPPDSGKPKTLEDGAAEFKKGALRGVGGMATLDPESLVKAAGVAQPGRKFPRLEQVIRVIDDDRDHGRNVVYHVLRVKNRGE